ncbi:hypothetical protein C8R43DRAFT_965868 [Mycena crocata]|nr:hypothetical protein C8R43DRAFT_965868 [Mycena crocata]
MHDLIRLAQLPAVRRVKTLTHIFDSYPDVTKLNVVSLAHTIADLRSSDFSASSQQPGVTSGSHPPPSVDIFLMDVGGFDLSHWRARFAEVGIVSIDDLRPLGRPRTRTRGTDESAPAAPPRTLRSSNVRAPAPVVLVERKARSVGRNAEPAAAGNPPPAHAPVQRCPASDPLFPTDASHPAPSIDCFLQDVGGYNLTRLSATFDAVGITSMHDLIRLAQLPAVRRVKTLTHIFDSYPDVTKLNVVSLAHTIADLRSSDFSASSQQPGVTSGSHPPPSVDIFLMDVGGFDLSHWRARFAEVGIVSIDDLRPLGRVPDTRRRQMLLDLLEPHPITTLHLVSLSLSVAELV